MRGAAGMSRCITLPRMGDDVFHTSCNLSTSYTPLHVPGSARSQHSKPYPLVLSKNLERNKTPCRTPPPRISRTSRTSNPPPRSAKLPVDRASTSKHLCPATRTSSATTRALRRHHGSRDRATKSSTLSRRRALQAKEREARAIIRSRGGNGY